MISHTDEYWMKEALLRAKRAEQAGEVPVGAVLVLNDELIGEGWNQPIGLQDPTAHAEIQALRQGALHLQNYRLVNTILYVTLEPCLMCVGAMVNARIQTLVTGAIDPKKGQTSAQGNVLAYLNDPHLNHQISCKTGVLKDVCGDQLKAFFKKRR